MLDLKINNLEAINAFVPRVVKWSSVDLLKEINSQHVTATPELRNRIKHDLWGDMCAENDAENLWKHLTSLDIDFTSSFKAVLKDWREDERNHYIGLRQICSSVYHIAEEIIEKEMHERQPDFTHLQPFLEDEFKICVVLAYDELVSARGYNMFFEDFKQLGPRPFAQWVKWAARDEALHYQNFLDVIKLHHYSHLNKTEEVINEIYDYENQKDYVYNATFLLDHTEETFTRDFLNECGKTVLQALTKT